MSTTAQAGPSTSTAAASPSHHPLSASTFRRLHPAQYLQRFLSQGYRPDGRRLSSDDSSAPDDKGKAGWRDVSINSGSISTASGSSLVRLGGTTIVCGVKAEIFEPDLYRPDEGCIVPNLDLPALCSPKFKPGPPGTEAQIFTDRLDRILSHPSVLPLESLCIHPSKSAWVLYVDAVCISYDGNAWDACLLAVMAALRNTRLPKARWDEDTERTLCSRTESVSLQLGDLLPVSTTFGLLSSKTLLPDPTAFEETLISTWITAILLTPSSSSPSSSSSASSSQKSQILFLEQTGLGGLVGADGGGGLETPAVLRGVLQRARERAQVLSRLIG